MGWFASRGPNFEPPQSPKTVNPFSVYSVLRELVGLIAAVRAELRQTRKEAQQNHEEVMMAFSDLKANVLQLITLAEAAAAAAASGGTGTPAVDIDALNQSVVDALHILTPPVQAAATSAGTVAPPPPPAQPASPDAANNVTAPPTTTAPATDPNAPAAVQ